MVPRLLLAALVVVHAHRPASAGESLPPTRLSPPGWWNPEPEACRARVSSRDCGAPPRPLFTYVRAAARCELVMWRGCPPTGPGNIFFSEFDCIRSCALVAHPHSHGQRASSDANNESQETANRSPSPETRVKKERLIEKKETAVLHSTAPSSTESAAAASSITDEDYQSAEDNSTKIIKSVRTNNWP